MTDSNAREGKFARGLGRLARPAEPSSAATTAARVLEARGQSSVDDGSTNEVARAEPPPILPVTPEPHSVSANDAGSRKSALQALLARSPQPRASETERPETVGTPTRGALLGALLHRSEPVEEFVRTPTKVESPSLPTAKTDRIQALRGMIDALMQRADSSRPVRAWSETPPDLGHPVGSSLFVRRIEKYLEPGHCHGRTPVEGALRVTGKVASALARDGELAEFDPRRMLILDTETTGLSGGTGTLPFLIGIAWFSDESLCVEQLLVSRPGHESPALEYLAAKIRSSTSLVTYNGKSFDWPLLRSRFVMNRMTPPTCPPHFDLLHVSRRLFRERLTSAKLVRIEEGVLGFRREDDVSGAQIPALYWAFVREGKNEILAKVLEHNASDVVALAALLGALESFYQAPDARLDGRDLAAMADLALSSGDPEKALRFATVAENDPVAAYRASSVAARACARLGRHQDARGHLEKALLVAPDETARAVTTLALAKILEHRLGEHQRAADLAEATAPVEGVEGSNRRVARLLHKLEKQRRKLMARTAMGNQVAQGLEPPAGSGTPYS